MLRRRDPCEDVEREHFSDRICRCKGQAVRMIATWRGKGQSGQGAVNEQGRAGR